MPRPLVLLVPALLFIACHGSPTEPEPSRGKLNGTVTFFETNTPAAGLRVHATMEMFSGFPETPPAETITDSDGRYSLVLNAGMHSVSVAGSDGHTSSFVQGITIATGRTTTQNFQVSSAGCAILSGRVMDIASNLPISGATVSFAGQTVISDAAGLYHFNLGCPPPHDPSAKLTVDHPSYQHREMTFGIPSMSTTIDLWLQK